MKTGRFRERLDPGALRFSSSLPVDRRLVREDIEGSLAHAAMLAARGIIPRRAAQAIRRGLTGILRDVEKGKVAFPVGDGGKGRFAADDIHMAVESLLAARIGTAAGLLHTARSRNDQVALDERLYLSRVCTTLPRTLRDLQGALVAKAREYESVLLPGYTHLQRAQPVLLAHHLLAYVEMLERDRGRFADCRVRAALSPLGAAALAGTPFPIDRRAVARAVHLPGIVENSIDAVGDRDAVIECTAACAVTMMHLSRLGEELVLWSSQEWRFVEIGEAFTTGSSIMPQKKNPDMAELVRGKTGRVYGDLVALLTMMKGLPLAYNRDMQEDKEPLFDAVDTALASTAIMAGMVRTLRFHAQRFEREMTGDFLLATELADYLVRKGMPFRKAHTVVGDVVRRCMEQGLALKDATLDFYREASPLFGEDVYGVLSPRASVRSKASEGSTAPGEVRKALVRWERRLRH
jgi:argininosuccinate lyase